MLENDIPHVLVAVKNVDTQFMIALFRAKLLPRLISEQPSQIRLSLSCDKFAQEALRLSRRIACVPLYRAAISKPMKGAPPCVWSCPRLLWEEPLMVLLPLHKKITQTSKAFSLNHINNRLRLPPLCREVACLQDHILKLSAPHSFYLNVGSESWLLPIGRLIEAQQLDFVGCSHFTRCKRLFDFRELKADFAYLTNSRLHRV